MKFFFRFPKASLIIINFCPAAEMANPIEFNMVVLAIEYAKRVKEN